MARDGIERATSDISMRADGCGCSAGAAARCRTDGARCIRLPWSVPPCRILRFIEPHSRRLTGAEYLAIEAKEHLSADVILRSLSWTTLDQVVFLDRIPVDERICRLPVERGIPNRTRRLTRHTQKSLAPWASTSDREGQKQQSSASHGSRRDNNLGRKRSMHGTFICNF